jgi:hypothetical protein
MAVTLHLKTRLIFFISPSVQVYLIKLALIILIITITGSGCAFSKYRLAKKGTPPPIEVNLSFNQPPVSALLHTVIIYKGPGSWKKEAYWDEYVFTIMNQGGIPLHIKSATLVDFQDNQNISGSDPWKLEKHSKDWWRRIRSSSIGRGLVLGAGAGVLFYGGAGVAFAAAWTGGSGAAIGAGVVAMAAAPVIVISSITASVRAHNKIEREFDRRRLVLPTTIQAGQVVKGSLFFPITPGPKRLILHYQLGEEEHDMEFDLSPLKGLHIKEEAKLPNP